MRSVRIEDASGNRETGTAGVIRRAVLAVFLLTVSVGFGTAADTRDGFGLGFSVGERGGDFALGVEAVSPAVLNGFLGFKAGGEILWKEGIPVGETTETWQPYYAGRLGIHGFSAKSAPVRLYGEFGGIGLVGPGDPLSELELGIYGLFGFEFFFYETSKAGYFIELGSTGMFGAADEGMIGSPLLATGFSASAGLRVRF